MTHAITLPPVGLPNLMNTDSLTIAGLLFCVFAGCSVVAGCIAYTKRRSPVAGVLYGLLLGPIGVFIEARATYVQRPMVDRNAWNSLNSMMTYQNQTASVPRRSPRLQ